MINNINDDNDDDADARHMQPKMFLNLTEKQFNGIWGTWSPASRNSTQNKLSSHPKFKRSFTHKKKISARHFSGSTYSALLRCDKKAFGNFWLLLLERKFVGEVFQCHSSLCLSLFYNYFIILTVFSFPLVGQTFSFFACSLRWQIN